MHRIKRQAKRHAWYPDDGDSNFNPFGKLWHRPSRIGSSGSNLLGDLEAGSINRAHTEADMESSADAQRREAWNQDDNLAHSRTLPAGRATSSHSDRGVSPTAAAEKAAAAGETTSTDDNGGDLRKRNTQKPSIGGILGVGGKQEDQDNNDNGDDEPKVSYTLWSQLQNTVFNSYINVLLLLVPVGIAFGNIANMNPAAVFTINFISIIPLAGLLSYATEEIAIRTGETIGGLLNATFGNAVELIVSILALFQNQYIIVQTSLVGSMLSNLLLVMGMCFFFGGLNKVEQHFNVTVAQTAASLLALAIGSLIIPTVYNELIGTSPATDPNPGDSTPSDPNKQEHISEMSHGTAILLLLVYAAYLYFQLSTHADMYNEKSKKAERRKPKVEKGDALKSMMKPGQMGASTATAEKQRDEMEVKDDSDDDEEETPKLSVTTAIVTLCVSTALVGLCAEYMTRSIGEITKTGALSQEFVGLILLPIVGNAAEHATAVTVAVKDKMDLAIGVAVGSSMQIALLVLPLVITIGWMAGHGDGLTLAFDGFQVIVLFVSVLLVNYLIADGKSHWLEGVLLQTLYMIIAIAAWFYPTSGDLTG